MFNFNVRQMSEREKVTNIVRTRPFAIANIQGNNENPNINGKVCFYKDQDEILVFACINNLPVSTAVCSANIFAIHIHEGDDCDDVNFEDALGHYNPNNCPHPAHAGDMPPLFANDKGKAIILFNTDRFTANEIIGKTVIIHSSIDDFTSQPSGDSGSRIGCGVIVKNV